MKSQPNFPTNRSKGGLDPNTVWSSDMIKAQLKNSDPMEPEEYCVLAYVVTFYDATTANAVIHPQDERACLALSLTKDELLDISGRITLREPGQRLRWVIHYDTSGPEIRILCWKPMYLDWVREHRAELKNDHLSINAAKVVIRYQKGRKAGLAKAIETYATALTPSKFTDFGFSKFPLGSAPYQIWHTDRNGRTKGTKMQHNCQFTHPILSDRTPAGYAKLAKILTLTDEMVAKSFSYTMYFSEIRAKFLGVSDDDIREAIAEINAYGWHTAVVHGSGEDAYVVITPTLEFHQRVWELDLHASGPLLTKWEVANNWIPFGDNTENEDGKGDPMRYAPPLGYHYLYGIRSARTGEFVTVGQTTTSLVTRKNSHERAGSNGDANEGILDILADPNDYLEIVHFATVHYSITSEKEMSLANTMLAMGHHIKNKILTIQQNNKTVKLDSRFGDTDHIKRNWWAIQEKLDLVKEAHQGKEILFMIDKLPTPETTPAPIDYEAVRWLLEPVAYLVSDEDNDSTYETRTHDELMWEAEERGAYSEMAA